jgi:glycosyltransferase involved in cell wall biosynthesis
MKDRPLISVIIPAFNSGKYLAQTIDSVLAQSYQNFEIIIVDDGSTDDTLQLAKNIAEKDNRIKVYSIPPAGRPSVPRNFGIQQAKGDLVAFLDSDDLWGRSKLDDQLRVFRNNPKTGFVYSVSVTFGDVNLLSPAYEVFPLITKAAKNREDLLKMGNTIPLSSVLIKASLLKEVKGFDEDPQLLIEDYDLWLRLSSLTTFRFLPRIHVFYRIHSSQFSADWETKKQRLDYLSKKRNIKLPEYKFRRTRGGFFSFNQKLYTF